MTPSKRSLLFIFVALTYCLLLQTARAQAPLFIDPDSAYYARKAAQVPFAQPVENKVVPALVNTNANAGNRVFNVSNHRVGDPGPALSNCYFAPDATYLNFPGNDDGSLGPLALPFGFNLFGTVYNQIWINNNGNITFTGPVSAFTASGFPTTTAMVAPFWADVDTRIGATVKYKISPTNVIVTWPGVGYYNQQTNLLNTFQLIISNGNDALIGIGNNVAFNYGDMQWTTGSASGGVGGFGGTPATVGINKGNNATYIQIGRFGLNNSAYDGPLGNTDGINYLDNQCFQFNIGNFGNLPPTVNGNPPNNTITIPCGQTGTISLQALPPEVGQSVTALVNTGGLCNTTVNTTNGNSASAVVAITGDACNQGTHTIAFTFTDNFNPPATTTVNITVIVQSCCIPPTITCPSDISVNNSSGQCGANVSYAAIATGTSPTITYSIPPGSFFPVGTTTVTATASNACGTMSCQFTVTVADAQTPVITCPSNITVSADNGRCGANVCYPGPAVSENCPPATPAGYTLIANFGNSYYYQSNAQSNYATAESNAIAAGGHLAVITSAAENSAVASSGAGYAWMGGNDQGTEGVFRWVTCEPFSYSNFCANEPGGGTSENYLEFETGGCWNDLNQYAMRFSILEIEGAKIMQTAGLPQNAFFPVGTTTNTFQTTDAAGNSSTCSFNVTVTDNEPPQITCPSAVTVQCAAGVPAQDVTQVNASDNCSNVMVTWDTDVVTPGDCPNHFTIARTYKATDASGNSANCTQMITVNDNTPPSLSDPQISCSSLNRSGLDQCLNMATAFDASTLASAVAALYSDNCAGALTATLINTTPNTGNTNCSWSFIYTFKIEDVCHNFVTCEVTYSGGDHTAPTLSGIPYGGTTGTNACKTNATAAAPFSAGNATQGYTDNCGGPVTATLTGTTVNGTNCNWTVTYTFSVKDECGNTLANQSYSNSGSDQTAPSLTGTHYPGTTGTNSCKSNAAAAAPFSASNATQGYTDNCGGPVTATLTGTSVTGTNCNWTVTYTYSVKDECGNMLTNQSYSNRGNDQTPPVAKCKPVSITLVNGLASITASSVDNGSSDNCGPVILSVSKSTFSCANIGSNTVILTARDSCGNASSCSAVVTVIGEIPTCSITAIPSDETYTGGVATNIYLGYGPQKLTLQVNAPASGIPYTYSWSGGPLSNNNIANPVFTATTAGSFTFTVVVTNKYGCTTTCMITVCVTDIRVPGTSGSKVYLCHLPPGNPGNAQTLSISVNAVSAHLGNHPGDRLGKCDMMPCTTATAGKQEFATQTAAPEVKGFTIIPMPNPSNDYFLISIGSKDPTPVTIRVINNLGLTIDMDRQIAPGSIIQIGHEYKGGTYYLQALQGDNRKVIKLVKLN